MYLVMNDDGADGLDDVELLRRSSRDPEAFGEFYDRHADAVMRYCLRRTGSSPTSADLTAEVFAAAYLSRSSFTDRGAPARAWLFGIARRQIGTFHRKARVAERNRHKLGMRTDLHWSDDLDRVDRLVELEDLREHLASAIDSLPDGQAQAVHMRIVEERSYRDIAASLGCSEGAARVRVSRGLSRLADALEGLDYVEDVP
jgi:RNA polymerase sigma factor (sigma-70 family)